VDRELTDPGGVDETVGLCAGCRHVEVVTTSKESKFYLCRLSRSDPRFRKYPSLPVRLCPGYEPAP